VESAELIAILQEVRDRVRARHPESAAGVDLPLPDLNPLLRARDAAMGKAAAIGSVNPRPGGILNSIIQAWKSTLARVLDWHVREQIVFNRKTVAALDAAIEAFAQSNRTIAAMGAAIDAMGARLAAAEKTQKEVEDLRLHWAQWRQGWEERLAQNEIQFLRSVADLQAAYTHRADLMDANYRDTARGQHADFTAALARTNLEIQQRVAADFERLRLEYDRLIHSELRLIRQRLAQVGGTPSTPQIPAPAETAAAPQLDYTRFAERFRGTEQEVKAGQRSYLPYFEGRGSVLDIGCGRGEFLETMRDAGIPAVGIDLSEEAVAACKAKGLDAHAADLFEYLTAVPESSLDGIFCSQVVEHIPAARLPEMITLCASRLSLNGVIALETPNPECLAIFATYFYLDPTHVRPVPAQLLRFYLEEAGMAILEVKKLSPAVESMPSVAELPEEFRNAFFGGLDYAVIAKKW
jgi:O-antigen chain-terminating methyltransferase